MLSFWVLFLLSILFTLIDPSPFLYEITNNLLCFLYLTDLATSKQKSSKVRPKKLGAMVVSHLTALATS